MGFFFFFITSLHYRLNFEHFASVFPLQRESDIKMGTEGDKGKGKGGGLPTKDQQNRGDQSYTKLRSLIPLSVHLLVSRLKP